MPRLVFLLPLIVFALPAVAAEPGDVDFVEKQVRPILAQHCYECHGPAKQNAGLRLDTAARQRRGGDSGPVIVPGKPDDSPLVHAIRRNGDLRMPPKVALPAQAVADLTEWVRRGAPWPDATQSPGDEARRRHWAFQPVANPAPPVVKDAAWARTPLDRFVLAKLEATGLSPSAPADKRTLIRRVTFDLTGLPPTPEEIDAFLTDDSPGAYAKVIERLLASPRYGERWARHWLDVARFADTKGYVFFQDANFPWAYTYRDYVIRAFNDSLPYDHFIVEQLAADQLAPSHGPRALTALGFLTLGGRFMNNVHDILDDRIDVVTRGLMGLTVSCARCHDHKFDPISQADYYGLYGVFASCAEPEVPPLFEAPPDSPAYQAFKKELDVREGKLNAFIKAQYDAVVGAAKTRVAEYLMAVHAQGEQPKQDDFMLLSDGNDINPTMVKRWRAQLERSRRRHDPVMAPWHAMAALPEKEFAAKAKDLAESWLANPDPAKPINPIVAFALASKPPPTLAEAAKRYGEILGDADRLWQAGKKANSNPTRFADPAMEQLRLVFHAPGAAPNAPMGQLDDLELFPDRPSQAKLQELRKAVEQWRVTGAGAPPRAHALVDRPEPFVPRVFLRGNPNQPGPAVARRMPATIFPAMSPFQLGSGRRELAQMIVDPANPLTARVFVNRVWMHHFGRGLVPTPSDFGLRSEPPSHPELLDYLATEFVRGSWSVKALHRMILLSATYQQRSDDRPECLKVDPENRQLWKWSRKRLDFEATRDALLAVAGRLEAKVGGPSAKDILSPSSTKRTMYGFVDRLQVPGLYRAFDFPSPDATSPQRDATTIPQQALYLMNGPFAAECARSLLRRPDVVAVTDLPGRVGRLYRICFGRAPTIAEMALAQRFVGDGPQPAWERYLQALLETNEFVFVD